MFDHDFSKSQPRSKETISSGIRRGASSAAVESSIELLSELSNKRASSKSYSMERCRERERKRIIRKLCCCRRKFTETHLDIKRWQLKRWTKTTAKICNSGNLLVWLDFDKIHVNPFCLMPATKIRLSLVALHSFTVFSFFGNNKHDTHFSIRFRNLCKLFLQMHNFSFSSFFTINKQKKNLLRIYC